MAETASPENPILSSVFDGPVLGETSLEVRRAGLALLLLLRALNLKIPKEGPPSAANIERMLACALPQMVPAMRWEVSRRVPAVPPGVWSALEAQFAALGSDSAGLFQKLVVGSDLFGTPHPARIGPDAGFSVFDLMVELAGPRKGESVLDPCFGTGELLFACRGRGPASLRLFGIEPDPSRCLIGAARAAYCGYDTLDLQLADPLTGSFCPANGRYDCILLVPNWGKLSSDQQACQGRGMRVESALLRMALSAVKPGGRIVMATNDGLLGSQRDVDLRIQVLQNFCLEDVVSLPPKTFPRSSVMTSLLVIRSAKPGSLVRFTTNLRGALPTDLPPKAAEPAARWAAAIRSGGLPSEICRAVPMGELVKIGKIEDRPENLQFFEFLRRLRDRYSVIRLTEVADVKLGHKPEAPPKKSGEPRQAAEQLLEAVGSAAPTRGKVGCIRISEMSSGTLGPAKRFCKGPFSPEDFLCTDDVLVAIKGSPRTLGQALLVPKVEVDLVAADSLARIRPKVGGLRGEFLAALLQGPTYRSWLSQQGPKSTINVKRLGLEVLRGLLIPLPSHTEQDALVRQAEREGLGLEDLLAGGERWRVGNAGND